MRRTGRGRGYLWVMRRGCRYSKFILTLRKDTATYVASLKGHHEREGIRNKDFVKPHWWDEVFGVEPANWDYEKSALR